MLNPPAELAPAPNNPPYITPRHILSGMLRALPRPPADAPEDVWLAFVQAALDQLGRLNPRDPTEAMLAIQIIATNAGAIDAYRMAFEAAAVPVQAARQRANAATLLRAGAGAMRLLIQLRKQPVVPACEWGDLGVELATAWRDEPPPVPAAEVAEAEPEEVIHWIDEIDDAELAIAVEADRREKAGEPALPRGPGPKVIYRYKPGDYALTWEPDERAKRKYPGWENMTKPERREFFGYTYDGPVASLEVLTPESQAAAAAGEE